MEAYNKLVRDKIPELLDEKGVKYEQRIASVEELKEELLKKFDEEALEFQEARSAEELGDVMDVIDALLKLPVYKNVNELRARKTAERGGFEKGIILKGEK